MPDSGPRPSLQLQRFASAMVWPVLTGATPARAVRISPLKIWLCPGTLAMTLLFPGDFEAAGKDLLCHVQENEIDGDRREPAHKRRLLYSEIGPNQELEVDCVVARRSLGAIFRPKDLYVNIGHDKRRHRGILCRFLL